MSFSGSRENRSERLESVRIAEQGAVLMAETLHIFRETASGTPGAFVLEPGLIARTWWLLRRSLVAAYEDNCFSVAKGAAYSFLLSLFPILTTLTSILIQANAR